MHDARNLVPIIRRDRENVMVTVHRRVRVAENLSQFRVAEQSANLGFHPFIQIVQLLANGSEFPASHVEDVPAAVDAPANRLRHRPQVFDASEQLDDRT